MQLLILISSSPQVIVSWKLSVTYQLNVVLKSLNSSLHVDLNQYNVIWRWWDLGFARLEIWIIFSKKYIIDCKPRTIVQNVADYRETSSLWIPIPACHLYIRFLFKTLILCVIISWGDHLIFRRLYRGWLIRKISMLI